MQWARSVNDVAVEIIHFSPDMFAPDIAGLFSVVPDTVAVGDIWNGTEWRRPDPTPPPVPVVYVPQQVYMRQARLQLLAIGKLDDVDTVIDSLPEPARSAARIEWEYTIDVQRTWPTLLQLAPLLGLDDAALDQLFVEAAKL